MLGVETIPTESPSWRRAGLKKDDGQIRRSRIMLFVLAAGSILRKSLTGSDATSRSPLNGSTLLGWRNSSVYSPLNPAVPPFPYSRMPSLSISHCTSSASSPRPAPTQTFSLTLLSSPPCPSPKPRNLLTSNLKPDRAQHHPLPEHPHPHRPKRSPALPTIQPVASILARRACIPGVLFGV